VTALYPKTEKLLGRELVGKSDEHIMHCIFPDRHSHGDRNKSASFNTAKGIYYCQACNEGLSVRQLVDRFNADPSLVGEILEELGLAVRSSAHGRRTPVRQAEAKQPESRQALPSEAQITKWCEDLLGHESRMKYLETKRCWKRGIIAALRIGYDGDRITFPIYEDGALVNIRRYKPKSQSRKVLSYAKGYGAPLRLWPLESLDFAKTRTVAAERDCIYVCEGESDVVALMSAGKAAITATGGAGKWPSDYSQRFADLKVTICADDDEAGQRHVEVVRSDLGQIAKEISVQAWK